jgi:hypothetical protein
VLAATLATACDVPFEPFQENTLGPFSVFGYLDLRADTQWIRVAPIRQNLLPDSAPIDAVVTLEHLGSGRVVTLRDSLFTFADLQLNTLGYAHNFWTTEPLEPEAMYRLRVVRSDGAATTALVEIPPDLEFSLRFLDVILFGGGSAGYWAPRQLFVQAQHLLYTDLIYTVADPSVGRGGAPIGVRQHPVTSDSGMWAYALPGVGPFDPRLDVPPYTDMLRREARIAVAGSDWPYEPGLSVTDVAIPGITRTTVENGVGSVVGVATWAVPLPICYPLEARPDGTPHCTPLFGAGSTSIAGRVERAPCSNPMQLTTVRLTERYADGGAVVWEWQTDWDGAYHFEGLEPGSDLLLEFSDPSAGALHIPSLSPGERYIAPDVTVAIGC